MSATDQRFQTTSPPPAEARRLLPPEGFVRLFLTRKTDSNSFYLEIPIVIITAICLNPLKYLRYLGWCVLGAEGLLGDEQGAEIPLNGVLIDQGIYRYIVRAGDDPLEHAVDLEVIKQRSRIPSETTRTREDFRTKLIARDGWCVWTGVHGIGMHIIPYSRGDEWLKLIIDNRPHTEDLTSLLSINDIRNGIYAVDNLHSHYFDPRKVAVLKTPNPILDVTDVPRIERRIRSTVSFPAQSRYTLQWLICEDEFVLAQIPNNNDATFTDHDLPKPADLLLHYNYGAAAVKQWGKNNAVLDTRPILLRPPVPVSAVLGPTQTINDRTIAIDKRAAAASRGQGERNIENDGGSASVEDSERQVKETWDEDEVMMFFWGNSTAARERYTQRQRERIEYMEQWRVSVFKSPVPSV